MRSRSRTLVLAGIQALVDSLHSDDATLAVAFVTCSEAVRLYGSNPLGSEGAGP